MQGTTDVAFTVLDVLGYLDEIPVCVGYEIDGEVTTEFPPTHLLEKAKPVLKVLPGWKSDIRGIKTYEELPENCRNYIEFIEITSGLLYSIFCFILKYLRSFFLLPPYQYMHKALSL